MKVKKISPGYSYLTYVYLISNQNKRYRSSGELQNLVGSHLKKTTNGY